MSSAFPAPWTEVFALGGEEKGWLPFPEGLYSPRKFVLLSLELFFFQLFGKLCFSQMDTRHCWSWGSRAVGSV